MVIYFMRHQAGGVLWEYPFLQRPQPHQEAALRELCARRHGAEHPKTREAYWLRVVEVTAVNEAEEIELPPAEPSGSAVTRIGIPPITLDGVAHVKNPEG